MLAMRIAPFQASFTMKPSDSTQRQDAHGSIVVSNRDANAPFDLPLSAGVH